MERHLSPRPDQIRQMTGTFGWVDHRFRHFWEDLSREELLLYYFLITVADAQSCSFWSTRKIAKILKIGPATLLRARQMLEDRRLIATRKDPVSQRSIYQVLPLPIDENTRIEIPIKYAVGARPPQKKEQGREAGAAPPPEEQRRIGLEHLSGLREMLNERP